MLKSATMIIATLVLCAPAVSAADYDCAKQETATRLNDHDLAIKDREAAIAEMEAEIAGAGGSTDEQKGALRKFEDKLEKMKQARAELLKECAAQANP